MKKEQHCKECQQTFYPSKGGYYDKADNQYICRSCGDAVPMGDTIVPIFKKQSKGSIIAKSVFAVLCFGAIFTTESNETGAKIILICTGLLLIACTVIPFMKEHKRMAAYKEQQQAKREQQKAVYRKCAHCGASTTGDICSYCGSPMDQK